MSTDLVIGCAYSDTATLRRCALPWMQASGAPFVVLKDRESMAKALDEMLLVAEAESAQWLCAVHEDVVVDERWVERARDVLERLTRNDPRWGLAGVFGTYLVDGRQVYVGDVRDSFEHRNHRRPAQDSIVETLDGLALFLRVGDDEVAPDPNLPGWDCYDIDLSMQAKAAGRNVYALDLPVEHQCKAGGKRASYHRSKLYVFEKWQQFRPITTSVGIWV